ncbi:hypothetical protein HPB48_004370 [Haemaphysalis longicornis]|uniref:Clip domain-containing protein n=1 Tax=Haemaphysalis longicornis TaxID=44386 RepID=A0A9J6G1L1_HAELO|nr:hypothetical protein HPB48_004370 [Haemaphysalis longicornis]
MAASLCRLGGFQQVLSPPNTGTKRTSMRSRLLGALVLISLASTAAALRGNSAIHVRAKRQGLLGSFLKPVLNGGRPDPPPQQSPLQGREHPHGAPIQDTNVVNQFLENLQRSNHNFNVPRRRSSFFGPAINALRQFQICTTPTSGPGKCRYVRECVLPAFLENFDVFLSYSCVVSNRHLGVCCPDEFFGNVLKPRKPLFPILSGLLNIGKRPDPRPPSGSDYDDQGPNRPDTNGQGFPDYPDEEFPDDDEEESAVHEASSPPPRPVPQGGDASERQKPLPPPPTSLAQLFTCE